MAKSKSKKSSGPFPVAEDESHEGLQTSGSLDPAVPADLTQEKLDNQLKSVMAEIKWRTDAMQHMTQLDANTYYQNNVKRLEDEALDLKERGAVEPEPDEEAQEKQEVETAVQDEESEQQSKY